MKLNIRRKLLLALAALLLVTAGLQQLYYLHALDQAAIEDVSRFQSSVSEAQINALKGWLDTSAAIVESTKMGLTGIADPHPALAQAAKAGKFDMIYIGTGKGEMLVSNDWKAPEGYDPRQRPWYKDAMSTNGMVITAPYADASTGQLIISLAEPIKSGELDGVIAGDVSIQSLV